MSRERPPKRRKCQTTKIRFGETSYHVTIGFYPDGRVAEIFAHGARLGSTMDAVVDDACILLSILLQHGLTATELSQSLGRTPQGGPASVIGAFVAIAMDEEKKRESR